MENYPNVHRLKVVNFDSSGPHIKSKASITPVDKTTTSRKSYAENQTYKIEMEKNCLRRKEHSIRIKENPAQYVPTTHRDNNDMKFRHYKSIDEKSKLKPSKLSSDSQKVPKYVTKGGKVKFGVKGQCVSGGKKQGSVHSYSYKRRRKSDVNELKLLFLRGGNNLLSSLHNFSKDVLNPKKKPAKNKVLKEKKVKCKKKQKKEVKVLFSRNNAENNKSNKDLKKSQKIPSSDDIFRFRKSNAIVNYQSSGSRSFGFKRRGKTLSCTVKRSVSCEDQTYPKIEPECCITKYDPCALHSVNLIRFPIEGDKICANNVSAEYLPSNRKYKPNIRGSGGAGDASKVCTQICETKTDRQRLPCPPKPGPQKPCPSQPCPPQPCPPQPCHESIIYDPCNCDMQSRKDPSIIMHTRQKVCCHATEIPYCKTITEKESHWRLCLKYTLFVLVILSWSPCIFVVILCWLISYPLRPHWIKSKEHKNKCYSGQNHRMQRYRCNKCRIPTGFWASFANWVKDFKWTNTTSFEAIDGMLNGHRSGKRRSVGPTPNKQFKLYHSTTRGWVMKSTRMRFPNLCYQRQYQCTTVPYYPPKSSCGNICREQPKKKRRTKTTKKSYTDPCIKANPDPCSICKYNHHDIIDCKGHCMDPPKHYNKTCLNSKPAMTPRLNAYHDHDPCTICRDNQHDNIDCKGHCMDPPKHYNKTCLNSKPAMTPRLNAYHDSICTICTDNQHDNIDCKGHCMDPPNKYKKTCLNLKPTMTYSSEYKVCIEKDNPCIYDPYTGTLAAQSCRKCLDKPKYPGCKISIAPTQVRKKQSFLAKKFDDCKKCFLNTVNRGTDPCSFLDLAKDPCATYTNQDPCQAKNPCMNQDPCQVCNPCTYPDPYHASNPCTNQDPCHASNQDPRQTSNPCTIPDPCQRRRDPCNRDPCQRWLVSSRPEPSFLDAFLPPICNIGPPMIARKRPCGKAKPKVCHQKPCGAGQPVCNQPYSSLDQPVCSQPTFTKRCWQKVYHCIKHADSHLMRAHEQCLCNKKPQEPDCWAARKFPTLYPMYKMWSFCVTGCCHICLYILSACVWCPPILCCYMCYEVWCSC